MGTRDRTRPDESRKPGKITASGYEALQQEASRLWSIDRPKVRDGVSEAAAEGDRSENAEYIYGKMKLAAIDRRLKFLGNRLEVLTVVTALPADDGLVHFASWVTVEVESAEVGGVEPERRCYRIVGADETDSGRDYISCDSPVAKALLGRKLDDEVEVVRPKGSLLFTIVGISSHEPSSGSVTG